MRYVRRRVSQLLFAFANCILFATGLAVAQTPNTAADRTIAPIAANLYSVRDGAERSLFVTTSEGIVLIDPLNVPFARWLKTELEKRFPNQPVKYVIYTGVDVDRISGSYELRPAIVIAHESVRERLQQLRATMPRRYRSYDANGDGMLETTEAEAAGRSDLVRLDRDRDGRLIGVELWGEAFDPDRTYGARETLIVGGERIDLTYTGPGLAPGSTAVLFPTERVAFGGSHPSLTIPFRDESIRPVDLAKWTTTVSGLDFDTLLSGEGDSIPHADVVALDAYVHRLISAVAAGREAGRSVAQIQSDPAIDRFIGTSYAAARDADIESIYRRMSMFVIDPYAAGILSYQSVDPASCEFGPTCAHGSTSGLGITLGVGGSLKRIRAAAEFSSGSQLAVTGVQGISQNSRELHLSILGGYQIGSPGAFNITPLAGVTFVRVKRAIGYADGFRPFLGDGKFETKTNALTFGADLLFPMGARVGLVAPIRLTTSRENLPRSGIDFRAGVGLRVVAFRAVR